MAIISPPIDIFDLGMLIPIFKLHLLVGLFRAIIKTEGIVMNKKSIIKCKCLQFGWWIFSFISVFYTINRSNFDTP